MISRVNESRPNLVRVILLLLGLSEIRYHIKYQAHILFVFRLRCSWADAYLLI